MSFSNIRNGLLRALPLDVLARMKPSLRHVPPSVRQNIIIPAKPIEAVFFVESGWISMVSTLDDGSQTEVGLVGRKEWLACR